MLARTSAVLEVTPDEAFDSDAASNVALAVLRMSTLINTTPTPMLSARAAKSGTDRPGEREGTRVALSRIHTDSISPSRFGSRRRCHECHPGWDAETTACDHRRHWGMSVA
mgnify:CR=1 FL=1